MIDSRYYHTFIPGVNKFDGFETDDFVPPETSYVAGSSGVFTTSDTLPAAFDVESNRDGSVVQVPPLNTNSQGQTTIVDGAIEFRPT